MSPRLAFALQTVREAGQLTLRHFGPRHAFDRKTDDSPVTIADREAEAHIRSAIESKYPEEGILGEEYGEQTGSGGRWVIDPIDGTKSFLCGVPLYATLLAFERENQPEMGIAYFPALDWIVYSARLLGTFDNDRKCRVSDVNSLADAVLSCGSHSSMVKFSRMDGLNHLARQTLATRTWSDAYGHCLVATGRVEAMIDPVVAYHDVAAIQVIVTEAGGRFTNFRDEDGVFAEAISTNQALHDTVLEAFRR